MSVYFSEAGEDAALSGVAAAGTWISLHTASPGTTGANEVSGSAYARAQTTWSAPGLTMPGSQVTIGVPAGTTVEYFGIWSAQSGGTYIGGGPLAANQSFAANGLYEFTPTATAVG